MGKAPQHFPKRKSPPPAITTPRHFATNGSGAGAPPRGTQWRVTINSGFTPDVLEYHLDDGTTTVSNMHFDKFAKPNSWKVIRTSASNSMNQGWVYPLIREHVMSLVDLDEDDPERVDENVALNAAKVLEYLANAQSAKPPEVFSHGGDAVVLTWEGQLVAKLLTITAGSVHLLAAKRGTKDRQSVTLDFDRSEDRFLLIQAVGTSPSTSSLVDDDI